MSENESAGDKPRDIGLRAVRQAREERGRLKHGRITGKAWLVAIGTVLTVIIVAWQYREGSLSRQKEETLAKQRAAVTTVGAEWFPLRDKLEKLTLENAKTYQGDLIDPEARTWDFRSVPGIYLRMRVEDAKDEKSLRAAAKDSARDSFVGCLLRENNPSMAALARGEGDAGTGWQDQPWNLRLAYSVTRVLGEEWADEVNSAEDEIHLRVFVQQYEKAKDEEIPLAVDIIKRAQFFLLVLDEDIDSAKDLTADAGKITERELQQVAHPTRVSLFSLKDHGQPREIVRLRLEAEADFRFAGERSLRDPRVLAAMKRQVNNCALAESVWSALRPKSAAVDAGTKDDAAAP